MALPTPAPTGSSDDILARLRSLIPGGWFQRLAPIRYAVLGGIADALSGIYALLATVRLQTRIATASCWFLDLIAFDFLGPYFLRRSNEPDASWRGRFITEIFRERATRAGLTEAVELLTGQPPAIIEPFNPGDCGGWDTGALAWAGNPAPAPALSGWDNALGGWSTPGDFAFVAPSAAVAGSAGAGCWGSLLYPFQIFLTVQRPAGQGTPVVAGWDSFAAGWGVGAIEWTTSAETGLVTDDDIYASIARTVPAGVTAWVAIISAIDGSLSLPPGNGSLDFSNPLNGDLLFLL